MNIEIIAEVAQGFEGSEVQARLLMKAAAFAGADAAKFQMVYADELATPDYEHYQLFQSLEMKDELWAELARYSEELGIKVYFDIFGLRSLKLAEKIGASAVKLHGTDISNIALLKQVAVSTVPKVILGAGGAYGSELATAISILETKEVIVLLGFQGYPTFDETNQISRVKLLAKNLTTKKTNVRIGFADHTVAIGHISSAISSMAVGAGACVLEKHLTLGKVMQLEDFESALNPDEFLEFTKTIHACCSALGEQCTDDDFGMSVAEQSYRVNIRRHVVASKNMEAGSVVLPTDLTLKRTSSKDAIYDLSNVYNKKVTRGVNKNKPLTLSDLI